MILRFPSLDVLRLALTSGMIADATRAAPVRYGLGDDQALWVEPAAPLTDAERDGLERLGVEFPDQAAIILTSAAHWLEMFPLGRDPQATEVGDKTPILFELATTNQLAELAGEILRLGNDRQSFRWLQEGGHTKALLRVVGPPYYSLLRAMDASASSLASGQAPIAYREAAPRVWVQFGYRHPLAEHIRPPEGQLLLLSRPHRWMEVPEGKLRDIYEVIDFQVPSAPVGWNDQELPAPIAMPLRLTRSGAAEAAELWLLREDGIAQLEELVRSSDNELVARLAFAVAEKEESRLVILRVRPSKNPPPVLVLDGVACRPYLRIPHLFVPVGRAIHPPLRREAIVKLLAHDPARVTWLNPLDDRAFVPESLPEQAFRPLAEWVDYVLEQDHVALAAWIGSTQFDFEGFMCKEDAVKKPPKEPKPTPTEKTPDRPKEAKPQLRRSEPKKVTKPDQSQEEVAIAPSELQKRLRALEDSFDALTTPLDDPERQPLWHAMAELNGQLGQFGDAAVCWANALWEHASVPVDWPQAWFRREAKHVAGSALPTRQALGILNLDMPTHSSLRQLTAYLIWAASLVPAPDLQPHLARVQRFLEKHEAFLGVRHLWLAWHAIYQLSGNDILTLVRARDRVLERLFLHGLTPELDLPGFMRFTSMQGNARFRMVHDQVVRLHKLVQDWARVGPNPTPATHAYIDLVFAFGLARLGETTEALRLRDSAAEELQTADEVHTWLYHAFAYRIQLALDGKSAGGRLSERLLAELDAISHPVYLQALPEGKGRDEAQKAQDFLRFKIDRMREKSRILEPLEKIDSYRHIRDRFDDELTRELARLVDLTDRAELTQRLQKLLASKPKKGASNAAVRILTAALELAPRLGQEFGKTVLDRVPAQLGKVKTQEERAALLEKSLFLAAHYDRKEDVQRYVGEFEQMLQGATTLPLDKLIPVVAGSFRSLRKFGLRDLVARLIERLGEVIHKAPGQRAKRLGLLLELASAWYYFGDEDRARPILDDARDLLFARSLPQVAQTELACAYVTTLGQAPMEFALARLMEFFRKVEGIYDNFTTTSHYSISRFVVVEATLLALVSDEFTLDREARKRLDDDEYLVRRRIHRDVAEALTRSGAR